MIEDQHRTAEKTRSSPIAPMRVLLPISIGTGLSLIGDSSLYAVLPTHVKDAGITLAAVGIILSANRFIRILLNGPAGFAYDRLPRRPLFLTALFIGSCSTAIYALGGGFWPLLIGRLLWGLSWVGIWVGGNTMILDVSTTRDRGRWVGLYNICFFLGTSSGSVLGGLLTDWIGYSAAMGAGASLTFVGAVVAWAMLPETSGLAKENTESGSAEEGLAVSASQNRKSLISAFLLMAVNRLSVAGTLAPTLGLLLLEKLGSTVQIGGIALGVTSATGIGLGMTHLVSMLSAPVMGRISDRLGNRWKAVSLGLVPGTAGFLLMSLGSPAAILAALPLAAFVAGSNQGLSIAIVGDLSTAKSRGRRMGLLFTIGDLASAVGPPLAYTMAPIVGLGGIYFAMGSVLLLMLLLSLSLARRKSVFPEDELRTQTSR